MLTATINTNGTVDLVGKQGTTWALIHSCFLDAARTVPFTLTGLSLRGQLRKDYFKSSAAVLELTCTILDVDVDTNPNGNKIKIEATAIETSDFDVLSGVYDVEAYSENDVIVERVMEGKYRISPEVTRPIPVPEEPPVVIP